MNQPASEPTRPRTHENPIQVLKHADLPACPAPFCPPPCLIAGSPPFQLPPTALGIPTLTTALNCSSTATLFYSCTPRTPLPGCVPSLPHCLPLPTYTCPPQLLPAPTIMSCLHAPLPGPVLPTWSSPRSPRVSLIKSSSSQALCGITCPMRITTFSTSCTQRGGGGRWGAARRGQGRSREGGQEVRWSR